MLMVGEQKVKDMSLLWYGVGQTRKELVKGNYREVHWNWGSLLLGLGVLIAIEGPVNTYLRTGDTP